MATKRRRRAKSKSPAIETVAPFGPTIDLGPSVKLTVKKATAEEIQYSLSDGSTVRLRPVIMGIERSKDKFNQSGEPIYQMQMGIVLHTDVPKKLKRKETKK